MFDPAQDTQPAYVTYDSSLTDFWCVNSFIYCIVTLYKS